METTVLLRVHAGNSIGHSLTYSWAPNRRRRVAEGRRRFEYPGAASTVFLRHVCHLSTLLGAVKLAWMVLLMVNVMLMLWRVHAHGG